MRERVGPWRQLGMRVTGVLAVLLRGKKMGHLEAIKPEIDALRAKAHFFIAPDLERAVLSLAERGGLTIFGRWFSQPRDLPS
jgi:predicted nucleic acid-binding protein